MSLKMTPSKRAHSRVGVAALFAAGLVAAALFSCAPAERAPVERKVMILGIDGLEWDIMGPMIETGRLPNLARLVSEGSWGELRSLSSLESPMIWTSISTGKLPEKHGIMGFTTKEGARRAGAIFTADFREARTLWDILGEHGRTVGVVNWLVTWPVEPVNGYLVSDYVKFDWSTTGSGQRDTTYPPELIDEVGSMIVRADGVSDERAAEYLAGGVPPGREFDVRLRSLKNCISVDETSRSIGLHLARSRPSDFIAFYMSGVDGACHHFWVDAFPGTGPEVSDRESQLFGKIIERFYDDADRTVGEFLELADENTTVIVMSDHGHSGPKPRGDSYAFGIAMHDPTGFIVLWGKDVVKGRELDDPSVLDVTPTVLALYDLPVADDMDGRVLAEAIEPSFFAAHEVRTVATYETVGADVSVGEANEPVESPVDDEIKERLRSLGYIE